MAGVHTLPSWEGEVTFVISIPLWTTWVSPWGTTLPPQYTITGLCARKYQRKRTVLSWWDLQDVKEFMHGVAGGNTEESHDRSPVNESEVGGPLLNARLTTTNLPGILSLLAGPILSLHKSRTEASYRPLSHAFPAPSSVVSVSLLSPAQSPSFCACFTSPHTSVCSLCHFTTGVGKKELTRSHVHKRTSSVLQAKVKRWSIQGERFSSEMLELRKGPDFGRF